MRFEEAVAIARGSPWLSRQSPDFQAALMSRFKLRVIPKGEALFHLDDHAQDLHCVVDGSLRASVDHPMLGFITSAVWETGEWIGQSACLGNHRRAASVHARVESCVVSVTRDAVNEMVTANPAFAWNFYDLIAESFEYVVRYAGDLLIPDARLRFYARLLTFAGHDNETQASPPVTLNWSKEELAHASCMSRQTVQILLNDLVERGICEAGYRQIRLVNPKALAELFAEESARLSRES